MAARVCAEPGCRRAVRTRGESRCWEHRRRTAQRAPPAVRADAGGRRPSRPGPERPARAGGQGRIADDREALLWLADRTRAHTAGNTSGLTAYQIMRNYHGIAALGRLAAPGALPHGASAVFAGGTCLALGHRLVERYSEDIDIVIAGAAGLSPGEREEVLDAVADLVLDGGRLAARPSCRRVPGLFTKIEADYPQTVEPAGTPNLYIRVDAGFADDLPARDVQAVRVETYLSLRGDRPFAGLYTDLAVPDVPAVKPAVTMAEKLIALHQRAVAGNRRSLSARARDVVDIGALASHKPTVRSLAAPRSTPADIDARHAARAAGLDPDTAAGRRRRIRRPPDGFADSPVWQPGHPMNKALENGYQGIGHLIYDRSRKPRFADVVARVHEMRDLL